MKKQIFFGHKYYLFVTLLVFVFAAIIIAIMVYSLIAVSPEVNPSIPVLYWMMPLFAVISITVIAFMGYFLVQYTVISEDGIKAKCLWCTIRKLKWEEVKEVRYERLYANPEWLLSPGWFVFDDGVVRRKTVNEFIIRKKANYITLRAAQQTKEIIEKYWHGPIATVLSK